MVIHTGSVSANSTAAMPRRALSPAFFRRCLWRRTNPASISLIVRLIAHHDAGRKIDDPVAIHILGADDSTDQRRHHGPGIGDGKDDDLLSRTVTAGATGAAAAR